MASISPSRSIWESVLSSGIFSRRISGGRETVCFSVRPGVSSPPRRYVTLETGTLYSSLRMPRIQTQAVSWYSGLPTRFPIEVLRLADAAVAIDEDAGVPEIAGRENGNGDKRLGIAKHGKRVGGERHFGDVKFPVADHPEKSFLDGDVDVRQVDPVDGNAVLEQRARAVIIPAGHRQAKLGHLEFLRTQHLKIIDPAIRNRHGRARHKLRMPFRDE